MTPSDTDKVQVVASDPVRWLLAETAYVSSWSGFYWYHGVPNEEIYWLGNVWPDTTFNDNPCTTFNHVGQPVGCRFGIGQLITELGASFYMHYRDSYWWTVRNAYVIGLYPGKRYSFFPSKFPWKTPLKSPPDNKVLVSANSPKTWFKVHAKFGNDFTFPCPYEKEFY